MVVKTSSAVVATRKWLSIDRSALVLLLFWLWQLISSAAVAADMELPRVVISSGGPYKAANTAQQNYSGSINVSAAYFAQPIELVCTSGSLSNPGFNWVRMFLLPDSSDTQIATSGQPIGRLLVDESSFLKSPISYTDVTGQFRQGQNKFIIEAAGPSGSMFAWELRSIGPPGLTSAAGPLVSGSSIILYGSGFSLRADENTVTLNGTPLQVVASNSSELKVLIPREIPTGTYELQAAIRQYKSSPLRVYVQAPEQQQ